MPMENCTFLKIQEKPSSYWVLYVPAPRGIQQHCQQSSYRYRLQRQILSSTMHLRATKEEAMFSPMAFFELFLGTPATRTVGHKTSVRNVESPAGPTVYSLSSIHIGNHLFYFRDAWLGLLKTSGSSR